MPEQEVTIAEALEHIKKWLKTGEKEKAEQGLREILEFQPENEEAKKLLENLLLAAPSMPSSQPAPTSSTEPATPSISSTVQPPTRSAMASSTGPAALSTTLFTRKKIIIIASALIGIIAIAYLIFTVVYDDDTELETPSKIENSEKVRRR